MSTDSDVLAVHALIDRLPPQSRKRVFVVAGVLRDLINAPGTEGEEVELAFTLVLAERAAS
jgi:hypothetical protein